MRSSQLKVSVQLKKKRRITSRFVEATRVVYILDSNCICSTSASPKWFPCQEKYKLIDVDNFVIVSCNQKDGKPVLSEIDIHLSYLRKQSLLNRKKREPKSISILVLEIDSISAINAQKFLSATMSVLYDLKLSSTFHVSSFSKANVLGAASVANSIALLAGCIAGYNGGTLTNPDRNETHPSYMNLGPWGLRRLERSAVKKRSLPLEIWCPVTKNTLKNTVDEDIVKARRWLFELAQKNGYITWFGEEFCTRGSP